MRTTASIAAVCSAVLSFAAFAATGPLSIRAHVLASGATVRGTSACFRLRTTSGEPAAGYSSSADYALLTGFLAHRSTAARDDIFFDAFEACP